MYLLYGVFVFCWRVAQSTCLACESWRVAHSTCLACEMAASVASILTWLENVPLRDESEEKLYKLVHALESPPSRERRTALRRLCSSREWSISLRADGKNRDLPVLEQELKTAAMRAYVSLRARESASRCGGEVEDSAQNHTPDTGTAGSVAEDGQPLERASQCKGLPTVPQTGHAAQGASIARKRQAEKHDELPHNKRGAMHSFQGTVVTESPVADLSQGLANVAMVSQDSSRAAPERLALKRLSFDSGQQENHFAKSGRSMSPATALSACRADGSDVSSSDESCEVVLRCVACDRHGCDPDNADQVPRCSFFGKARGQLGWNASAAALRDTGLGDNVPHFAQADVQRVAASVFLINGERYKLGASPGEGNNCLIHALQQCCSAVSWQCRADAAAVRLALQKAFPAGVEHEVLASNFLTLDVHWRALLQHMLGVGQDIVDASFSIWCLDVRIGSQGAVSGDAAGSGPTVLRLARTGENHFVPFVRATRLSPVVLPVSGTDVPSNGHAQSGTCSTQSGTEVTRTCSKDSQTEKQAMDSAKAPLNSSSNLAQTKLPWSVPRTKISQATARNEQGQGLSSETQFVASDHASDEPRTQRDELPPQGALFSADDVTAQASMQWLHDNKEQAVVINLLTQISEWDELLERSAGKKAAFRQLALQHKIQVGRVSRTVPKMLEGVRNHFLSAIQASREHLRVFSGFKRQATQSAKADTQKRIEWAEVGSFATLARFAYQQEGLPQELRKVIRYLNGGMSINQKRLQDWSREVGYKLRKGVRFAGLRNGQKQSVSKWDTSEAYKKYGLQRFCFERVRQWAAQQKLPGVDEQVTDGNTGGADVAMLKSVPERTPQSPKELADMMRQFPLFCPFGADFEVASSNEMWPKVLNTLHSDVSRWLALMELNGFAFGADNAFHCKAPLPFDYIKIVEEVVKVRSASNRSNAISDAEDLALSLSKNAVFENPVGLHDLMLLALPVEARQKYNPFRNTDASQSLAEAAMTTNAAQGMVSATDAEAQSAAKDRNDLGDDATCDEAPSVPPATEAAVHSTANEVKTVVMQAKRTEKLALHLGAARLIATSFLEFVQQHRLHEIVCGFSERQLHVIAVFHAQLKLRPPRRVEISERLHLIEQKPLYVASASVPSPSPPHFAKVADDNSATAERAVIQAPVICQLCGDGFVSQQALWQHCSKAHSSWCEYRKRLIYEIQQRVSVPLRPVEKRRLAGNYMEDLCYSRPARGTYHEGTASSCMRQIVACVVCAEKDFIDEYYPCYLWKEAPADVVADHADDQEADALDEDDGACDDALDQGVLYKRTGKASWGGPQLRDEDGTCYLGCAQRVQKLLNVEAYAPVVPLCPVEELHASSAQHPRFPEMRWLLHTRRVPMLKSVEMRQEAEQSNKPADTDPRPPCAGVGDLDSKAWLCHECASHLCRIQPQMPPKALANWNWGGREHPAFKGLSLATRSFLGIGRMLMRLILLKPKGQADETEKALVGNTILVSQANPQQICSALPPSAEEQAEYFNVVYSGASERVTTEKAFRVDRAQYMECVRLRAQRCPLFAQYPVDGSKAQDAFVVDGVAPGISAGAIEMSTVEHFAPNLTGPATYTAKFRNSADDDEDDEAAEHRHDDAGDDEAPHQSGDPAAQEHPDDPGITALDALIADENANAEFLIGLDANPDDCVIGKLAAFRAKLQLAEKHASKLTSAARAQAECRAATAYLQGAPSLGHASANAVERGSHLSAETMNIATDVGAASADLHNACVDLRTLARQTGRGFQEEVERQATAALRQPTATPTTLKVSPGAPMSQFDPSTWVACFVEFFYGDCAPNLERPTKIGWRRLFNYLMNREELEYHLKGDSSRYVASTHSRWDTPEFAEVFVDTLRKIQTFQSTKGFWEKHGSSFAADLRTIAKATDKEFQAFQANLRQEAMAQGIPALVAQAKSQQMPEVQKVLQHMLMHTTNVCFTEGRKMAERHEGSALNLAFGAFGSFYTANFADTYSPLTVLLSKGATEPLGTTSYNLLQDSPPLPTSQEMHKIVAARPTIQAKLFLLLDALTHMHLQCCRKAWLGKKKYDCTSRFAGEPSVEEDFAGYDLGIVSFPRALIKSLEAQGRGFAHGHEKVHSVPLTSVEMLMRLVLDAPERTISIEQVLETWQNKHRQACLDDASTKQYDSAAESGRQFGVNLLEILTQKQRERARLDGGLEEDGTTREEAGVVPRIVPAHVLREQQAAESQGRPLRDAYRGILLTGAPGARLPMYLLRSSLGRQEELALDEDGNATDTLEPAKDATKPVSQGMVDRNCGLVTDDQGHVYGFRVETQPGHAKDDLLLKDACVFSRSWAHDCRVCHSHNGDHDCKATCFKHNVKRRADATEGQDPTRQGMVKQKNKRTGCRFRFYRLVQMNGKVFRRLGKARVGVPFVAQAHDDNNEYGRCVVRRENPFRASSNDVSQVCLRCNVDLQHQLRTFPQSDDLDRALASEEASFCFADVMAQMPRTSLPKHLGSLLERIASQTPAARKMLESLAVAMRSSHVADFYATKYLAKPQQWLTSVLGPLIAGFRRARERTEAETKEDTPKASVYKTALSKMRTAIFAANRSIWISCCEAALYLQTGGTSVVTHDCATLHARRGLFMMHECKRILNKQVPGAGLWHASLASGRDRDTVLEFRGGGPQVVNATETLPSALSKEEQSDDDADYEEDSKPIAGEPPEQDAGAAEILNEGVPMSVPLSQEDSQRVAPKAKDNHHEDNSDGPAAASKDKRKKLQVFQVTVSVRDDWLHRGPYLHDMDLNTYVCVIDRVEKPLRGVRLEALRKAFGQVFPFERHYKLAGTYMQVLRKNLNRIPRYVGPNCLREIVNGGEENAAYKAFHCSLMRCPGIGQCAEPSMCSSVLFPNAAGVFVFKSSWRAREAEILTLAARGRAKKDMARKLEVLADTTLCKVRDNSDAQERANREREPTKRAEALAEKFYQIDVQRYFHQGLRQLQDGCEKAYPHDCAFVCIERPMQLIWAFAGVPCLWHPEQLHLAEWQAMGQLEWLFNLSLSVDAKSTALEKVAQHKKSSSYEAEPHDERLDDLCYVEVEDLGGAASEDEVPVQDEDMKAPGALAAPVSKEVLMRILGRDDEVALARQPGQGRREGVQNMRAVHDAFRSVVRDAISASREVNNRRISKYNSSEVPGLLEAHERNLQQLLEEENTEREITAAGDVKLLREMMQSKLATVKQMSDEEVARWFKKQQERPPIDVAKELCDAAGLNRDQMRPVALLAKKLQTAWLAERGRREHISAQERDELALRANYLPLKGRLVRMLVYGGGGCGKTLLVNQVVNKLLQHYYGPRGVIRTAFSNKAARLIKGKTGHAICKLRGGGSLTTPHLRVKTEQEQRNLAIIWAPAGAGLQDEFSQNSGSMAHAQALRGMYGRANAHSLVLEHYAEPQSNWASLPVWMQFGDYLQFPPIPATGSLLADPSLQSREHRVAVQMFADQDYVCCLRTAMRFRNDPALERILTKMRTPGKDQLVRPASLKLTSEEWKLIQHTDLANGATLDGTELWHHAGYPWTVVCMAQWVRSQLSAAHHKETLYLIPAHDHVQNVSAQDLEQVRDELLRVPSMNATARLPAVAMLHKGMHVRFTQTVSPLLAPVDSTGTVESIEIHEEDRRRFGTDEFPSSAGQSVIVLRYMPCVLVKIDDCEEDTGFGPGIIAVNARVSQAFSVEVSLSDGFDGTARTLSVKARREQVCLVVSIASTLYTLQGTTCHRGLIYHWRFPARLDAQMRWLAVYMVLSRVPTLSQLRSIGLDERVRDIINQGPPPGMLTRFRELFEEKSAATDILADEAMQELGW